MGKKVRKLGRGEEKGSVKDREKMRNDTRTMFVRGRGDKQ